MAPSMPPASQHHTSNTQPKPLNTQQQQQQQPQQQHITASSSTSTAASTAPGTQPAATLPSAPQQPTTMSRPTWKQQPPPGQQSAGTTTAHNATAGITASGPTSIKRHLDVEDSHKTKKPKRKGGKACVYCRRSHMVCEGGRPCERCIKRDIAHLCRDVTPPSQSRKDSHPEPEPAVPAPVPAPAPAPVVAAPTTAVTTHPPAPGPAPEDPTQVTYEGSSSWPLLPGAQTDSIDLSSLTRDPPPAVGTTSTGGWGVGDNAEFGILSDMLKTLRVPTLPGGFVDVLSQVVNNQYPGSQAHQQQPAHQPRQQSQSLAGPLPDVKGKARAQPLTSISRIEQYLLAAADQPDGSRASRLTQVIRAKYEAGLLKPYDYIKGYERMNRWMDSGRAARLDTTRATSPTKGGKRLVVPPAPPSGSSISPESRRRILAALEVFRPKFRRIAKELTDLDLVFVEEANERLMLQYDRALASIHTPSCIWRRTGEIQKANQEFAKLTGIPAPLFRNGQLCVYELMDEDSAVRFWEGYGRVASEKGQSKVYTHCTLKIPLSLTRPQSTTTGNTPASAPASGPGMLAHVPELALPHPVTSAPPPGAGGAVVEEEYRVIKTCFSMTIRRDRYEIPVAIMGQWIPTL